MFIKSASSLLCYSHYCSAGTYVNIEANAGWVGSQLVLQPTSTLVIEVSWWQTTWYVQGGTPSLLMAKPSLESLVGF